MQVKNQWENAKLRDIINPPSTTVQNLKLLLLVVTDITWHVLETVIDF
jgi:hypothetical protein